MKKLALLVLALSVSLFAFQEGKGKGHGHGGGGNPPPPPPPPVTCDSGSAISMAPSAWCVEQSPTGFNPTPTLNGWSFPFPPAPLSIFGAVTAISTAFAPTQSMTMTFRLTASDAVFTAITLGFPPCPGSPNADFWFFLEHSNNTQDLLTWRWWGHPNYVIQDGTYDVSAMLSVPLQPQFWSDVDGHFANTDATTLAGFMDTLANVGVVGISVGSGCFAGHGTLLESGTASMEVDGFSVQ